MANEMVNQAEVHSVVYLFNVCVWWFISSSPQIQLCKNAERLLLKKPWT